MSQMSHTFVVAALPEACDRDLSKHGFWTERESNRRVFIDADARASQAAAILHRHGVHVIAKTSRPASAYAAEIAALPSVFESLADLPRIMADLAVAFQRAMSEQVAKFIEMPNPTLPAAGTISFERGLGKEHLVP